jgi:hypothetical protein
MTYSRVGWTRYLVLSVVVAFASAVAYVVAYEWHNLFRSSFEGLTFVGIFMVMIVTLVQRQRRGRGLTVQLGRLTYTQIVWTINAVVIILLGIAAYKLVGLWLGAGS